MKVSTRLLHRTLLVLGMGMLLAAAQCVTVPPPRGGAPVPTPSVRYANAVYTKATRCQNRIGRNGGRGFYNAARKSCFSCPRGYRRSAFSVTSRRACVRRLTRFRRAERLGRSGCKATREFNFRGNCYRCPTGYHRVRNGGLKCWRRI